MGEQQSEGTVTQKVNSLLRTSTVPLEKTADEGPRVRVPVTRVGHPAPGWHWLGPALTVAGIWGVFEIADGRFVSPCFSNK